MSSPAYPHLRNFCISIGSQCSRNIYASTSNVQNRGCTPYRNGDGCSGKFGLFAISDSHCIDGIGTYIVLRTVFQSAKFRSEGSIGCFTSQSLILGSRICVCAPTEAASRNDAVTFVCYRALQRCSLRVYTGDCHLGNGGQLHFLRSGELAYRTIEQRPIRGLHISPCVIIGFFVQSFQAATPLVFLQFTDNFPVVCTDSLFFQAPANTTFFHGAPAVVGDCATASGCIMNNVRHFVCCKHHVGSRCRKLYGFSIRRSFLIGGIRANVIFLVRI